MSRATGKVGKIEYICQYCKKVFLNHVYRINVGRGKFCSKKCQYAFGIPEEMKKQIAGKLTGRKIGPHSKEWNEKIRLSNIGKNAGEKNAHWKGGVTKECRKDRNQSRYAKWRKAVLAVGRYVCANCGDAGNLDTHHVHGFLKYPELRYEVENGLVLCEPCHYGLHFPLLASGA